MRSVKHTIYVLSLILVSCGSPARDQETDIKLASVDDTILIENADSALAGEIRPEEIKAYDYAQSNIENTIGVVIFDNSAEEAVQTHIALSNDDGTDWLSFNIGEDESKDDHQKILDKLGKDLYPRIIKYNYSIIVFDCTAQSNEHYTVVTDYKTRATKKLRKGGSLKFETWQQHLLSGVMITPADGNDGALLDAPDGNPVDDFAEIAYRGVEVQGDWLKLCDMSDEHATQTCWIRWRKGNELRVQLFYLL